LFFEFAKAPNRANVQLGQAWAMNASPPHGDSGLRLAPREQPPLRSLQRAATDESSVNAPPVSSTPAGILPARGRFTFVCSLLLVALAFCLGLSYFLEKRWSPAALTNSDGAAKASALTVATAAPGPVGPQSFRISAVSLSSPRMAIVNGRQVSEGETFPVQTDRGIVNVTVEHIGDGTVKLMVGGQVIETPIRSASGPKNSP
jgi:hypothetical protein